MNLALVYILQRFLYRIGEFARHWYVKSIRKYSNFVINVLQRMDRVFAWRITARNLFEPLYKDYTFVGYVMGFFFRSMRLVLSSVVYALVFCIAIAGYGVWLLVPIYLVVRIIM